ncbi:MAG: membrane dipeptidase [Planctomycetota bacterium]
MTTPRWFDAHLDLAYLAELGRDMHAMPADARGRLQPAAVTLPALRDAGVTAVLGTIFTEQVDDPAAPGAETGSFAYPAGDVAAAYVCGMRQLKLYQAWREAGIVRYFSDEPKEGALSLGVLIENADPIPSPDELADWTAGGVVAVGLCWAMRGRYACGNHAADTGEDSGLTDLGRAMIEAMDAAGVIHDASHLSDRSLDQLFERTDRLVIASHSNVRTLAGDSHWHLRDESIAEIARRGGVVGLNLFREFIKPGMTGKSRPTVADAVDHVERICEITGSTAHVGLGSDMDGGLTALELLDSVEGPGDLGVLGEELARRGWTAEEIEGFRFGNWARIFPGA